MLILVLLYNDKINILILWNFVLLWLSVKIWNVKNYTSNSSWIVKGLCSISRNFRRLQKPIGGNIWTRMVHHVSTYCDKFINFRKFENFPWFKRNRIKNMCFDYFWEQILNFKLVKVLTAGAKRAYHHGTERFVT